MDWKIVYLGTLDCLTIVTDSPQKTLFGKVNWFDTRKMTCDRCREVKEELIASQNNVFFDCFGELSLTLGQFTFGHNRIVTSHYRSIATELLYGKNVTNYDGEFWSGDDR